MNVYKNNTMSNIEDAIKLAVKYVNRSVLSMSSPKSVDPEDVLKLVNEKVDKSILREKLDEKSNTGDIEA